MKKPPRNSPMATGRGRSLSLEECERVRQGLQQLRPRYENQEALARALKYEDGRSFTQQTVSAVLNDRATPGIPLAQAVAVLLGVTYEELVKGRKTTRRYEDLPGWKEAVEQALAEGGAPAYALEHAGHGIVSYEPARVDKNLAVDEAFRWLKHAPLEVRREAERQAAKERATRQTSDGGEDPAPAGGPAHGNRRTRRN